MSKVVLWEDIPTELKVEMLELQYLQTGKRDSSIFKKNVAACRAEGGIDWPKKFFEQWHEALKEGDFTRVMLHITASKHYSKSTTHTEILSGEKKRPDTAGVIGEKRHKGRKKGSKNKPKNLNKVSDSVGENQEKKEQVLDDKGNTFTDVRGVDPQTGVVSYVKCENGPLENRDLIAAMLVESILRGIPLDQSWVDDYNSITRSNPRVKVRVDIVIAK